MNKRKTIGMNPLDAVIPMPAQTEATTPSLPTTQTKVDKQRLTIHLPVDLIDRIKNAVYWTPGLTLAGLAEGALQDMAEKMERERGEPFPLRRSELKGGRPLK